MKARIQFLVIGGAIKQLNERVLLVRRIGRKSENMHGAGDRSDLKSLLLEYLSRSGRLR